MFSILPARSLLRPQCIPKNNLHQQKCLRSVLFPYLKVRSFHSTLPLGLKGDPYKILGVERTASESEIKKKYYELAKKFHPDICKEKDAQDKFLEIQQAYELLSDDKKRAAFDNFGQTDDQAGFSGGTGGFGAQGFDASSFVDPADIFSQFFGGAFSRAGGMRGGMGAVGKDINAKMTVTFMEAAKGAKHSITYQPIVNCGTCKGSGLKSGKRKTTCSSCRGTGQQTFVRAGFQMTSICSTCNGEGSYIPHSHKCGTCDGLGRVRERKTISVDIPPGIDDGMQVRLAGMGDAPVQGHAPNGDLFITVEVEPSPIFTRKGSDIFTTVNVDMITAILGGPVRVPTIDGDVEMKIPPGTQPSEEKVLRGRGTQKLSSRDRGNQIVKLEVKLPKNLTLKQKKLLEEAFGEHSTEDMKQENETQQAKRYSSSFHSQRPKSSPSHPQDDTSSAKDQDKTSKRNLLDQFKNYFKPKG